MGKISRKTRKSRKAPKLKLRPKKASVKKEPVEADPVAEKIKQMKAERKPRLKEMKMLEDGVVPEKNKIGKEFKGKNRVIIA